MTNSFSIWNNKSIFEISCSYHFQKKEGFALTFTAKLPNSLIATKIMICATLDLSRENNSLKDDNCYLLFEDLENKDLKNL